MVLQNTFTIDKVDKNCVFIALHNIRYEWIYFNLFSLSLSLSISTFQPTIYSIFSLEKV